MQLHTAAGITKELRRNKVGDNDIKASVVDFTEFKGGGVDLFMAISASEVLLARNKICKKKYRC